MSAIRVLYRKEMLETLRDRRTLAMMVLVPVVLYPILLLAMGRLVASSTQKLSEVELTVARVGADVDGLLPADEAPPKTQLVSRSRAEAEAGLRDKSLAAFVEAEPGALAAVQGDTQGKLTIFYTQRSDHSIEARRRLERALDAKSDRTLDARLRSRQLPLAFAKPVDARAVDIDFKEDLGPLFASRVLPLLMTMMLFLGALYAAIDVTAGEKERGTMETLLVTPVRTLHVMLAKYLAVSTLCIAVMLANVGAMAVTFGIGLTVQGTLRASVTFSAQQVALLVLALVPAAFLVSGVCLAVATFARSFKEGQDLMTPVLLGGLAPGIAAMLPGAELTPLTALIPLYNVALLIKGTVLGSVGLREVALVLLSTIIAAVAASLWAARRFGSEQFRLPSQPKRARRQSASGRV